MAGRFVPVGQRVDVQFVDHGHHAAQFVSVLD
jgi:hypothetical protein